MTYLIKETVDTLNNLLEEAVCHGGDSGGAYRQNARKLISAIEDIMDCLDISEDFEIAEKENKWSSWCEFYIREKKDNVNG